MPSSLREDASIGERLLPTPTAGRAWLLVALADGDFLERRMPQTRKSLRGASNENLSERGDTLIRFK